MGWEFGLFAIQIVALFTFGRLRAKLHPGSGRWKGKLPPFVGFIEPAVCRALVASSWLSDAIVGSRLVSQPSAKRDAAFRRRNAMWMDAYVLFCIFMVAFSYAGITVDPQNRARWWLLAVPGWRLADVVAVNLRINLFDHLIIKREPSAASATRMLVLVFLNFLEISLCFACFYAASGQLSLQTGRELDWIDPKYFSWITQLTIGYGDMAPESWMRLAASVQGLVGLLVLVLIIGRFASSLPQIRSLHTHESESHSMPGEGPEQMSDA